MDLTTRRRRRRRHQHLSLSLALPFAASAYYTRSLTPQISPKPTPMRSALRLVLRSTSTSSALSSSSASSPALLPTVSISDLRSKSAVASAAVRDAFTGRSSLGALAVQVPGFDAVRRDALRSGAWLALDPSASEARDSCRRSDDNSDGGNARVVPGWSGSPGRERHPIQSGYYCNLREEGVGDDGCAADDVFGTNAWPPDHVLGGDGVGFRDALVEAGRTMHDVTSLVLEAAREAAAVEAAAQAGEGEDSLTADDLTDLTTQSGTFLPLRLAYYDASHSRDDALAGGKYWLPWHVDFNVATAFVSASWIDEGRALAGDGVRAWESHGGEDEESESSSGDGNPEHRAGLLLRNARGDVVPASIPDDCVLVQLGAYAQIISGGLLRAGPHAVGRRRWDDNDDATANDSLSSFGRLTLGLFVYAPWEARMLSPNTDHDSAVLEDDFGGLMKKAYTGDTVLAGFQKFADYMNAPRD